MISKITHHESSRTFVSLVDAGEMWIVVSTRWSVSNSKRDRGRGKERTTQSITQISTAYSARSFALQNYTSLGFETVLLAYCDYAIPTISMVDTCVEVSLSCDVNMSKKTQWQAVCPSVCRSVCRDCCKSAEELKDRFTDHMLCYPYRRRMMSSWCTFRCTAWERCKTRKTLLGAG